MKVLIVTACGAKKNSTSMPAFRLYKSARIKAVYNRRNCFDMCILSAEHGLIDAHQNIKPYERVMDERRADELVPAVAEKLKGYDYVVFFKGGARRSYFSCIKAACERATVCLVTLGYGNMGGINDLPRVMKLVEQGNKEEILKIPKTEVYDL